MTAEDGQELITQTEAARLRGMTLAAVNEHVRSGRWRSIMKYGKRLVYRADVVGFNPKTHKLKHLEKGSDKRKSPSKPAAAASKRSKKTSRRTKAGKSTASRGTSGKRA